MSEPILKHEELSNITALIEGVQTQNSRDIYDMNYLGEMSTCAGIQGANQ